MTINYALKTCLINFSNKNNFSFYLIYLIYIFEIEFCLILQSPSLLSMMNAFMIIKKNKLDIKNKKINNISNMNEFFYKQSNSKVGATQNNL